MPVLGTEIEYGVHAPGVPPADVGELARAIVRHAGVPATPCFADSHTRMLGNGGRLYVDHDHPEYCTPEVTNARDAVVWELAGDRLVARAAAAASEELGVNVAIYRNNTDGKGQAYGYHENVLVSRAVPWERLAPALATFLVTRVAAFGAGRLGLGPASEQAGFQLSQRADFFERVSGLDTMRRRGIVNTRDEPHADPARWRRLHIIAGDANRNQWATWLRLGSLLLFVRLAEADRLPGLLLADPVAALRTVSRDLTVRAGLPLAGGGTATALEIQAAVAEAAGELDLTADEALVAAQWERLLGDLARDPASTADRLDWPARLQVLTAYRQRLGCPLDDPRLLALDLAWAQVAESSPWAAVGRAGRFAPWWPGGDRLAERVAEATLTPPSDTRAHARGRLITDHLDRIVSADWAAVLLRGEGGGLRAFDLADPRGWTAPAYAAVAESPWLAAR